MPVEVNLFQEDNLVRFLNEVSFAEDIITTLGLKPNADLVEAAESILDARGRLGAFFDIDDVEEAVDLDTKLGKSLLEAARRPLFMSPAVARLSSIGFAGNPALAGGTMLAPFLLPGGVFFAITWEPLPQEWVRPLMFLMMEIAGKRQGIELKLTEAEAAVAGADRQLEALQTQPNPDPGVLAEAKEKLETANRRVKAVEREADALNKLIKKKDHKGVWAIVKRNLEAEVKALKQRARGMPTTTPQEVREKQEVEDEAARKEREIARVDGEVAAYTPP